MGNIEDADVLVSASKEIVDESGFATADVNDLCSEFRRCLLDEFKGCFKVRTVPTDRVCGLPTVHILPMGLRVHSLSVDIRLANHKPITKPLEAKVIGL